MTEAIFIRRRRISESKTLSDIGLQLENGGAGRDRTDDLKLAKLPLSQLSYGPQKLDGGPGKT